MSQADAASSEFGTADAPSSDDYLSADREAELLAAHREGDGQALAILLRSYQRRVYSVCYRMLRNPDEASDITQDTLVRVIERIASFDGRARLSTWIIRIAMNNCLTHLRRERIRRHGSLEEPVDGQRGTLSDVLEGRRELSADERIEQDDRRRILLRALRRLDPDERSMLVLRDLQRLDYQQIADVLEVPIGTVKSRLFRARASLRAAAETEGL